MFMSFKCCNNEGLPLGNRVCINMKKIENITEMGQWTAVAQPPETNWDWEDRNPTAVVHGVRPRRLTTRAHVPDTFVLTPNCVEIFSMQNSYRVIANFEELTKILESLNDMFEPI